MARGLSNLPEQSTTKYPFAVLHGTQLDPGFWQIGPLIGDATGSGDGDGPPIPTGPANPEQIGDGTPMGPIRVSIMISGQGQVRSGILLGQNLGP